MKRVFDGLERFGKGTALLSFLFSALTISALANPALAGEWFSMSKYAYFGGELSSWESQIVEGILTAGPVDAIIGEDPWIQMAIFGWTCYMTEFSTVQIDSEGKDYYAAGTWEIQKGTVLHIDNASNITPHMTGLGITKVAIATWQADISDIENVVINQLNINDVTVIYFTDENYTGVTYGKQTDETGKFPPGFVFAVYGLNLGNIDMGYDVIHGCSITGGYFDSLIFVDWGGLHLNGTWGGQGGPRIEVNLPTVTSYASGHVYVTDNWKDCTTYIEGIGTFSGNVWGFNLRYGQVEHSWTPPTDTTQGLEGGAGLDPRADVNSDYKVNIVDLTLIARAFGAKGDSEMYDPRADLNSDFVVNILDIGIVAINFGMTF